LPPTVSSGVWSRESVALGGASDLRIATNMAHDARACSRARVVLICVTEVVSAFANTQVNCVRDVFVNVAPALFSDYASALICALLP
jgi:hypothetical protein